MFGSDDTMEREVKVPFCILGKGYFAEQVFALVILGETRYFGERIEALPAVSTVRANCTYERSGRRGLNEEYIQV